MRTRSLQRLLLNHPATCLSCTASLAEALLSLEGEVPISLAASAWQTARNPWRHRAGSAKTIRDLAGGCMYTVYMCQSAPASRSTAVKPAGSRCKPVLLHPPHADCLAELEAGMGLSYPPDTELAQRCDAVQELVCLLPVYNAVINSWPVVKLFATALLCCTLPPSKLVQLDREDNGIAGCAAGRWRRGAPACAACTHTPPWPQRWRPLPGPPAAPSPSRYQPAAAPPAVVPLRSRQCMQRKAHVVPAPVLPV